MSLFKKVDLLEDIDSNKIKKDFMEHIEAIHSVDYWKSVEKENILLRQHQHSIDKMGVRATRDRFTFSPSGVSKCEYELYLKLLGYVAEEYKFPYHRRWTRNASAVHEYMQRDLLYAEDIVPNCKFRVKLMDNGLPAWEENLKTQVKYLNNNMRFTLSGMMDGILLYDGKEVGFEYKTKSTTLAAVGDFKLRDIDESHKQQATAYSLMFNINTFIFMYESLAKDGWTKNELAKPDYKVFVHTVTEEDKVALLNKLSRVCSAVTTDVVTVERDFSKCLFCQFKEQCKEDYVSEK